MEIIQVQNNWREDVLGIDMNLGNYCNYSCWYCFPGANTGTHKFPDVDLLIENITHLIEYYKRTTNKRVFDIRFSGGEVTHWKQFPKLLQYLKDNFNCLLSITSNGSKSISWWQQNAKYFDRIQLSCHHEFVDITYFRDLCDALYEQRRVVSVTVMMDPGAWDKCMGMVEYLKGSRRRWTIRYGEIYGTGIEYTAEQKAVIETYRARSVSPFFFLFHNKYYKNKVFVVDSDNKRHRMEENGLLLHKLNNFYGWSCTAGVHWINVSKEGTVSATCSQLLYGRQDFYNLYDVNFKTKFYPVIEPVTCTKTACMCLMETYMPKRRIEIKKI
jgi:organic radical activating enzyme